MFQSAWFLHGSYSKEEIKREVPSDFITKDRIKYVRTIYYDEHCLECSAPACYKTCMHYKPRKDYACMRFEYGIKCAEYETLLWYAKLKFRNWAKLEARINKGSLDVKSIKRMDTTDRFYTSIFKSISAIFCKKNYLISTKWDGLKRKKYAEIGAVSQFVNDFLFQCFYAGEQAFSLIFEIADDQNITIYKASFQIKKGYNQEVLKLDFFPPEGGLVRLYPENNHTAELHIFAADFVQLTDTVPTVSNKQVKCVAWDLDNTVWDGTLIETEPDKLVLRKHVKEVMEVFDKRGIIQIVVSKNESETVLPVLKRLGVNDYFVYVYANWGAKSNNIFNAARMLNINVDAFALIDDSEFERYEVKYALPCVRVYEQNKILDLLKLPEFNLSITEESAMRRRSYQQEMQRKMIQNKYMGNNIDFIRNCEFKIEIFPLETEMQRQRSLELIQRTNQLNLSAKRYSKEEFNQLIEQDGGKAYVVYAKDKFGDYGQVIFLYFKLDENIVITEFAMSCRVAAKYIENALFATFQKVYRKDIKMLGNKTGRNGVLLTALKGAGFIDNGGRDAISLYLPLEKEVLDSDVISVSLDEHM